MGTPKVLQSPPSVQDPSVSLTREEAQRLYRESMGLPPKEAPKLTFPVEGHVCDFPLWSYSKKLSIATETTLRIDYDTGGFFELVAPKGIPGPSFPGYLDCILYYGQGDLFSQEHKAISVYRILKTLGLDATIGPNYVRFSRDLRRAWEMYIRTDRFRNPETGERSHVSFFRVLQNMEVAKSRREVSIFTFDHRFLTSLRSGYLKRLDFDFALYLDKGGEALARFLYGHLIKRIGEKSMYQRDFLGFMNDVGLGGGALKRVNERYRRTVVPALDLLKGEVITHYQLDGTGHIFFLPKG